jgi:hypothetical protein
MTGNRTILPFNWSAVLSLQHLAPDRYYSVLQWGLALHRNTGTQEHSDTHPSSHWHSIAIPRVRAACSRCLARGRPPATRTLHSSAGVIEGAFSLNRFCTGNWAYKSIYWAYAEDIQHMLSIYRAYTEHILSIYRAYTEHIQSIYRAYTEHIHSIYNINWA